MKYAKTKNHEGSRTNHQLSQCFNILNYVLELTSNKIKENDKFRCNKVEKSEDLLETLKLLLELFKELLLEKTNVKSTDSTVKSALNGGIIFTYRFLNFLQKNTKMMTKSNTDFNQITKIFNSITTIIKKQINTHADFKIHEEKLINIEEYLI